MKRVWIAIILITVVLWGCFASQHYLTNITTELAGQIYDADRLAQEGDLTGCADLVYSSYKEWKAKESSVGAIIRHLEMDNIESLYIRTLQCAVNKNKGDYLVESKELQGLLLHLADMEKPKIKNLF